MRLGQPPEEQLHPRPLLADLLLEETIGVRLGGELEVGALDRLLVGVAGDAERVVVGCLWTIRAFELLDGSEERFVGDVRVRPH